LGNRRKGGGNWQNIKKVGGGKAEYYTLCGGKNKEKNKCKHRKEGRVLKKCHLRRPCSKKFQGEHVAGGGGGKWQDKPTGPRSAHGYIGDRVSCGIKICGSEQQKRKGKKKKRRWVVLRGRKGKRNH